MQCLCSASPNLERQMSKAIDGQIKLSMRDMRRTIKLLLLGAGEAGKSTMVKQMKIWHDNGYTEAERKSFLPHIHSNILEGIVRLAVARENFGYALDCEENCRNEELIRAGQGHGESLEKPILLRPEILTAIGLLWQDAAIQKTFARRKELQLNDSVEYFMNRLDCMGKVGFVPDQKDVLCVRVRSTSIFEYSFLFKKCKFRIVDVGGQRTERRKWIHCFEGVNYIFYVASLSDYNKILMEDGRVNRMRESLALFRLILQQDPGQFSYLDNSAVILFLNKTDIFQKDIQNFHLADFFPEYKGPRRDVSRAQDFILDMYRDCNSNKNRPIFHHFTCCIDTEQFQQVFKIVRFHIIDKATREGTALV